MQGARFLSFDLDGTLTDVSFVDSVWLEGVPREYAVENDVPFEVAKQKVMSEYVKISREKLEWYDLGYWTRKLGLNISPQEILSSFQHRIRVFPEVFKVLEEFRNEEFRLLILTDAHREFADPELEKTGLICYFDHVFSSTSDFGLIKNTVSPYRKMCSILGVSPEEIIHVGDDKKFDFDVPRRLGMTAFYLDRNARHRGKFVVNSLREFKEEIARLA